MLSRLRHTLRVLRFRRAWERDLEAELRAHLAHRAADLDRRRAHAHPAPATGRVGAARAARRRSRLRPGGRQPLLRVRDLLGDRAASEHWIASRTRHPHSPANTPGVRLIDATSFTGWFDASSR